MLRSILFLSLSFFVFTSCNKCKDVSCLNGGTCDKGECTCLTGFSGENCEIEDECITNQVECLNGGVCVDGTCDCPDWWTGVDCGTQALEEWVGLRNGNNTCGGFFGGYVYEFSLSPDAEDEMIIKDKSLNNPQIIATFSTKKAFTIAVQDATVDPPYTREVEGSGSFSSTGLLVMVLDYTYTYPSQGSSTSCTFSEN